MVDGASTPPPDIAIALRNLNRWRWRRHAMFGSIVFACGVALLMRRSPAVLGVLPLVQWLVNAQFARRLRHAIEAEGTWRSGRVRIDVTGWGNQVRSVATLEDGTRWRPRNDRGEPSRPSIDAVAWVRPMPKGYVIVFPMTGRSARLRRRLPDE
jgi:hypothetical protein